MLCDTSSAPALFSFTQVFSPVLCSLSIPSLLLLPFTAIVSYSVTSWTVASQAPLSSSISRSLLKFTSIESVMLFNHLILCCPLLLLLSIFPSIRVFSSELILCIRWPKYWSFSFNISPSNEYSRLISFRFDWFNLAVQGTFKSLLSELFVSSELLSLSLSLHLLPSPVDIELSG